MKRKGIEMDYFCDKYLITEKQAIARDIYSYTIKCGEAAKTAQCGQFVDIKADGFTLRRPISICDIDKEKETIRIVFEIRGEGTKEIAQLDVGDYIDMIAPLGRGFNIPKEIEDGKKVVVIGGGIGVPPLFNIAKQLGNKATAILGFRSYDRVILTEDFKSVGADVILCTDDGSVGEKGLVTIPLKRDIEAGRVAKICACGPTPMLKAIIEIAEESKIPCEVSMEQRMGCGVGACLVCSCMLVRNGKEFYGRVCKDGPVFKSGEVVL